MTRKVLVGLVCLCGVLADSSLAVTRYVSPSGGNTPPYTSWGTAARRIHDAVNVAVDGDVVLVTNGTYGLNADIMVNPQITIQSVNGPASTIVDGSNTVRCFTLNNYNITLKGFTLKNGFSGVGGGGVRMAYGGTLRNCIIRSNRADDGGGIYTGSATCMIASCTIEGNYASGGGGGVYLGPYAWVYDCAIIDNRANNTGGGLWAQDLSRVTRCLIRGNAATNHGGGGVFFNRQNNQLEDCLVVSNWAKEYAGGLYAWSSTVVNCTFSYNHAGSGGGVYLDYGCRVTNSIIYFNTASGSSSNMNVNGPNFGHCVCTTPAFGVSPVTANPLFVNSAAGIYQLRAASPCIDAGVPTYISAVDLANAWRSHDGNGDGLVHQDIGCYELVPGRLVKDYNGDGQTDLAVYQGLSGNWYIRTLPGSTLAFGTNWGFSGVTTVPGDYNRDGVSDMAVFSPALGNWYIRTVAGAILAMGTNWGFNGCVTAPGNYRRDTQTALALFHPPTGNWYIRTLGGEIVAMGTNWGFNTCATVPGDYDGDGVSDLAVFHAATGRWYIREVTGPTLVVGDQWGFSSCVAVPGDYDGDGISDMAVYDTNTGNWYIRSMTVASPVAFALNWGFSGCTPVSMDADGDGKSDLAVYHAITGKWYIRSLRGEVLGLGVNWGNGTIDAVKP